MGCCKINYGVEVLKGKGENGMNRALLQVQVLYDDMGPAERLAADYLLSHTEEILSLSIVDFAAECGTSEATIVRLSRKLGYSGYQDLKLALAHDAEHRTVTPNIDSDDSCYDILEKVCNDAYLSLERTKRSISRESLERAAELLANAGRIVFVGLGSSSAVADEAANKLLRAGCNAASYSDTHMQMIAVSYLGEGDVAVGVSQSGTSKDIVEALKAARSRGVSTICITGKERAPITRHSDVTLLTDTEELRHTVLALNSHIARLAVVDALCFRVAYHNEARILGSGTANETSLQTKRVEE